MCYNCGCKLKDDKMGDDHNITLDDIAMAAVAMDMNGADTLKNIKELLEETSSEELDQRIEEVKKKHEEEHQKED